MNFEQFSITAAEIAIRELLHNESFCVVRADKRKHVIARLAELESLPVPARARTSEHDSCWGDNSELLEGLQTLQRNADGVVVLTAMDAVKLGLADCNVIVWVEAENTSPMDLRHIAIYADFWSLLDASGLHERWTTTVMSIDRYGAWRFLDLRLFHYTLLTLRSI